MKSDDDLELNAFTDGELSEDQQAELLDAMRNDPDLARQALQVGDSGERDRLGHGGRRARDRGVDVLRIKRLATSAQQQIHGGRA